MSIDLFINAQVSYFNSMKMYEKFTIVRYSNAKLFFCHYFQLRKKIVECQV